MRIKRIKFDPLSLIVGIYGGRNPVSGQRFVYVAPLPFVGIDIQLRPYVNDQYAETEE